MKRLFLLSTILITLALPVIGQEPPPEEDPLAKYFYPPELVMSHQRELGLEEDQRDAIRNEIRQAQGDFVDLQWRISDETEAMKNLVRQTPADEAKILAQVDRILEVEREIKRRHLSLVIRIRNVLSPEQLAQLEEIRRRSHR